MFGLKRGNFDKVNPILQLKYMYTSLRLNDTHEVILCKKTIVKLNNIRLTNTCKVIRLKTHHTAQI